MEWSHTAEVFGTTLANLKRIHNRAVEELEAGVDVAAAGRFLSSFGAPAAPSRDSSEQETPPPFGPLAPPPGPVTDEKKKARWRTRLAQWFTLDSADKAVERSYHELLARQAGEYDPLALDYSFVYWALSPAQREVLSRWGAATPAERQAVFREPQMFGGAYAGTDFSRVPPLRAAPPKEEVNAEFALRHPHINVSFSGTKLRALKQLLARRGLEVLEPVTAAISWVYFEKLVLRNCVTKENRRAMLCACLALAAKFHEDARGGAPPAGGALAQMFSVEVAAREVAALEFAAFAGLAFDLRAAPEAVAPHLAHLLAAGQNTRA